MSGIQLIASVHDESGPLFNIAAVEDGRDSRTTLMIKNVPREWTTEHVMEILNRIAPRSWDHVYMPMNRTGGKHRAGCLVS